MDIHDACENGQIHEVIRLIERRECTVYDRSATGKTPLHCACIGGHLELVKLLLGQKVTYHTTQGAIEEDSEVAKIEIFGNGSGPVTENIVKAERTHVLDQSLCVPHDLLAAGDSRFRDNYGATPLITLASSAGSSSQHLAIARELIKAGDPVNSAKHTDRMTPLCWASYHGNVNMVELLLHPPTGDRQGANPAWPATDAFLFPLDLVALRAMKQMQGREDEITKLAEGETKYCLTTTSSPKQVAVLLLHHSISTMGQEHKLATADGITMQDEWIRIYYGRIFFWATALNEHQILERFLDYAAHEHALARSGTNEVLLRLEIRQSDIYGTINIQGLILRPLDGIDADFEASDGIGGCALAHVTREEGQNDHCTIMPGERLAEINGTNVTDWPFEKVKSHICALAGANSAAETVALKFCDPDPSAGVARKRALEMFRPLERSDIGNLLHESPLHYACHLGHDRCVAIILDLLKKRYPNQAMSQLDGWQDAEGNTPVHKAAARSRQGNIQCVKLLMKPENQIELGNANNMNWTELEIAVQKAKPHLRGTRCDDIADIVTEDFVFVFDETGLEKMELLREGFTQDSEETPGVTLQCKTYKWSPPGVSRKPGCRNACARLLSCWRCRCRRCTKSLTRYYLFVKTNSKGIETWAKRMGLRQRKRSVNIQGNYETDARDEFAPFSSLKRQQIIYDVLRRKVQTSKVKKAGHITNFFAVHRVREQARILREWLPFSSRVTDDSNYKKCLCFRHRCNCRVFHFHKYWYGFDVRSNANIDASMSDLRNLQCYFGQKVANYVAWTEFHTHSLLLLAVPGIAAQVLQYMVPSRFGLVLIIWIVFVCIWTTMVSEMWKRTLQALYAWWGVRRGDVGEYSRPEYVHDTQIPKNIAKFMTGETEEVSNRCKRWSVVALQVLVTLLLLGIVFGAWMLTLHLQSHYPADGTLFSSRMQKRYLISAAHATTITILNAVYDSLATTFTIWENHKHDGGFETSLAMKTFIFSFFNSYLSLFWWAFISPNQDLLVSQLVSLVIVKQISDFFVSQIMPRVNYHFQLWRRGISMPDYLSLEQAILNPPIVLSREEKLRVIAEVRQDYTDRVRAFYVENRPERLGKVDRYVRAHFGKSNDIELWMANVTAKVGGQFNPSLLPAERIAEATAYLDEEIAEQARKRSPKRARSPVDGERKRGGKRISPNETLYHVPKGKEIMMQLVCAQDLMKKRSSIVSNYIRLIMEFGYSTMFAAAFPLAPLLCLLSNAMEIRATVLALLTHTQRPHQTLNTNETPEITTEGLIDLIVLIQEFMTYTSVVTNCGLLFITFKDLHSTIGGHEITSTHVLWLILLLEHALILCKVVLAICIPDTPAWVPEVNNIRDTMYAQNSGERVAELNQQVQRLQARVKSLERQVVASPLRDSGTLRRRHAARTVSPTSPDSATVVESPHSREVYMEPETKSPDSRNVTSTYSYTQDQQISAASADGMHEDNDLDTQSDHRITKVLQLPPLSLDHPGLHVRRGREVIERLKQRQ